MVPFLERHLHRAPCQELRVGPYPDPGAGSLCAIHLGSTGSWTLSGPTIDTGRRLERLPLPPPSPYGLAAKEAREILEGRGQRRTFGPRDRATHARRGSQKAALNEKGARRGKRRRETATI